MFPSCDFLPYWVAFFSGRLACQYRALVLLSFRLRKVILKKTSEVVCFSLFSFSRYSASLSKMISCLNYWISNGKTFWFFEMCSESTHGQWQVLNFIEELLLVSYPCLPISLTGLKLARYSEYACVDWLNSVLETLFFTFFIFFFFCQFL